MLEFLDKGVKKVLGLSGLLSETTTTNGAQGKDVNLGDEVNTREITLKITKGEYVTPGLYPIPKP